LANVSQHPATLRINPSGSSPDLGSCSQESERFEEETEIPSDNPPILIQRKAGKSWFSEPKTSFSQGNVYFAPKHFFKSSAIPLS
jgi:hypothetical protein